MKTMNSENIRKYQFYYNPRDPERFLQLIFSGKQIPDEKKEKIVKAYKIGTDSQYFTAHKFYNNEIKFISKIVSYKEKDGLVVAKFQNGFTGQFDAKMIADNADDFYNLIKGLFFVKIRNNKIVDIYSIEPANNYEVANELLENATKENETYKLLLESFGYDTTKMDPNDIFLTITRLFSLFSSPITKRKINQIEISNRGTGKTTIFMIFSEIFSFRYYTEMPSYANLIYDARNNMYGAVYLSEGLIFDEIQNWKDGSNIRELGSINATLSTGLENCIWSRGAGTESKSATIQKCIPIFYAGNPLNMQLKYDIENYLYQYQIFTPAILDRIHIVQLAIKKTYDKLIHGYVLYPSILRALVDLIQKKLNKQNKYVICDNLSSRRLEQSIDIQLILQALDIGIDFAEEKKEEICNKITTLLRFTNFGDNPWQIM